MNPSPGALQPVEYVGPVYCAKTHLMISHIYIRADKGHSTAKWYVCVPTFPAFDSEYAHLHSPPAMHVMTTYPTLNEEHRANLDVEIDDAAS